MAILTPISPESTRPKRTTLIFRDQRVSLSEDSNKITDVDGNVVFEIEAHAATISFRSTLKDAAGHDVGQIHHRGIGWHPAMCIGPMDDGRKCTLTAKGMFDPLDCHADIYVGEDLVGEAMGNWRERKFKIRLLGKKVAVIYRGVDDEDPSFVKECFCLDVGAGVDMAFVSLITIGLDQLFHEKKRNYH